MMEYYELESESNYNPKLLSANISCKSMSSLSSAYSAQQNSQFADRINMDIFNWHNNYNRDVDRLKADESELLNGFSIHKKSCIYKRPEYNDGLWKEQYKSSAIFNNDINMFKYKLFDYQTKNKLNVIRR